MNNGVVFNNTNYEVSNLVSDVDSGIIALPDLQRPFVWKDKQIRDLIDSLYKGLPTGLIILWKIGETDEFKPIGFNKSTTPNRLVIDGQQRLTSLYTVFTGNSVLDKNYEERHPKIAFNPITEEFEVLNSVREKNPEWINNVSTIFKEDLFDVVNSYEENLKEKRPDFEFDAKQIRQNIQTLSNISHYPFSVLELSSDLNPEEVSEIFVRINSKGKVLNQSDLIKCDNSDNIIGKLVQNMTAEKSKEKESNVYNVQLKALSNSIIHNLNSIDYEINKTLNDDCSSFNSLIKKINVLKCKNLKNPSIAINNSLKECNKCLTNVNTYFYTFKSYLKQISDYLVFKKSLRGSEY